MGAMRQEYGSVFAYDDIVSKGQDKLAETIRCGGMHNRKSMIIFTVLNDVHAKYGQYNLDHLHSASDDEAMKELLSLKYMGQKSASVVMTWSLSRVAFTVDTHVYRITGLWGWRPEGAGATREKTQSHLEVMIPDKIKFDLHFLFIQHGRKCPACVGGAKAGKVCEAKMEIDQILREEGDVKDE